jgi:hypothetical protein
MSEDNEFEKIAEQLSGLVGEGELQAREYLGNEQYEKMIEMMEISNQVNLQKEQAYVKCGLALTNFYNVVSGAISVAVLLGIAWSIYAWVN